MQHSLEIDTESQKQKFHVCTAGKIAHQLCNGRIQISHIN